MPQSQPFELHATPLPKPKDDEIVATAHQNKLPIPAWAQNPQSAVWTTSLIRALKTLGQDLVQADIRDAAEFCPAYPKLTAESRTKVWVQLISAMAKYESDLNPISAFTEAFKDRDGKPIVSRGLLQISKGSANAYGCNIQKEADLEKPEINLQCGVRILNTLVPKYHAIHGLQDDPNVSILRNPWRGAARYWSVLRSKAKDWLIRNSVRQMSVCSAAI